MSERRLWFTQSTVGSALRGLRSCYRDCVSELYRTRGRLLNRLRVRRTPLRQMLLGGEGGLTAGRWAELIGDEKRASVLLVDSPHVRFLQTYRIIGEDIFRWDQFEQTAYCQNALACIRHLGHHFGQTSRAGVVAQARAFVTLFERKAERDSTETDFPSPEGHSPSGGLPLVCKTWTPGVFQILDGAHRLAIEVALGRNVAPVIVLPPVPTELQRLVMAVRQTDGRRELYQPIPGPEFDQSWHLVRRCEDRLSMMLRFLAEIDRPLAGLSALDLACSYGWFVAEFARRGCRTIGVDPDAQALKIGRIAYGLEPGCLHQTDLFAFMQQCRERFDVVLLLSVLHHFLLKPGHGRPEDVLRSVDKITGTVLFLDTGQAHEQWFADRLGAWDVGFIADFIKRNTSFTHVFPLRVDSDNVEPYGANYGRTLFAAVRSESAARLQNATNGCRLVSDGLHGPLNGPR
jgi:SAM-dependent methyltransferase